MININNNSTFAAPGASLASVERIISNIVTSLVSNSVAGEQPVFITSTYLTICAAVEVSLMLRNILSLYI